MVVRNVKFSFLFVIIWRVQIKYKIWYKFLEIVHVSNQSTNLFMVFGILTSARNFSTLGLLGLIPAADISVTRKRSFGMPNWHFSIESLKPAKHLF